jgi:hypothetical protein
MTATSPASSGPAGPHFEAQVAAYYLLSLLTGAEPRGLPGTTIDRIQLQRGSEGHPLDDVIVHAHDARGIQATLAIQVKRDTSFAPADPVFRAVVEQITETARQVDLRNTRYEMAIAIARTSHKIDGAYQEVLAWARDLGSAASFFERISRPGSANDDMRRFVQTFRSHLAEFGGKNDDETIWRLLCQLQILVFDFTARGSASEELARERAAAALHSEESHRGPGLWVSLIELAMQLGSRGGERTRETLLEDLREQHFRLAGSRRFASARLALSEAAHHALQDIDDRVGKAILTRQKRLESVRDSLERGRYIEIRGDAGVGKSAILKHLALQIARESQILVLTPDRTEPRGWFSLKSKLGFDGSARELLADLAADGGATLFIDSLENFREEERTTVSDLVLEAARVPGMTVIATARRSFATDDPHWLPSEALGQLGAAPPVIISELSDTEVDELRDTAPALAALLSDHHPAREVARNLYRLSRLSALKADNSGLRTEIDMAEQWWQSADGDHDDGHRDRSRLLTVLAKQALTNAHPLDATGQPSAAITALVRSETLRDLGNDSVVFRHDVLREWAIANVIYVDPATVDRLPLQAACPVSLVRGVELAARMALERTENPERWSALLGAVSGVGVHLSWRRAVLFAPVRSEAAVQLLAKLSEILLANRGAMLCELIRIVRAVDTEPLSQKLLAAGLDPAVVPADLKVPAGPSWLRLIVWILRLGETLPDAAIPDVVELYVGWCVGLLGRDALTPKLVRWLYHWLLEIETARWAEKPEEWRAPFGGELEDHQVRALTVELRRYCAVFANRVPDLAAHYLQLLKLRRPDDVAVRAVLGSRGTFAQAAPVELAQLTASVLMSREERVGHDRRMSGPFEYLDYQFVPASPAQGPFYELLIHATDQGLALIRQLVDYAVAFYSRGREPGSDGIRISFPEGERFFPWIRSYNWSRDGVGHSCVTSALMALEAWAHSRVEAGAAMSEVLESVLGAGDAPAAYLLVAVDLLLSHWEKSQEVAIPFLASPELLCLDLERQLYDTPELTVGFGLSALQKEPIGVVSLKALKTRLSRRYSLDTLLSNYAIGNASQFRPALTAQLLKAKERLGTPSEDATLRDPELMVLHAIYMSDPANYREVSVTRRDGTSAIGFQYKAPADEMRHFGRLQAADLERQNDTSFETKLSLALENPERSSPEFAAAAVIWARGLDQRQQPQDGSDENWMREQAIFTAALVAARDGSEELREENEGWIRQTFDQALQVEDDPVRSVRPGIRYNPVAIAFVGWVNLLKHNRGEGVVRTLLEIAAKDDPAGASGLAATSSILAEIDPRLPRSLVRCAFVACVRGVNEWDATADEKAARKSAQRKKMVAAVDAEWGWLTGAREEPPWPVFPFERVYTRRRLRIPGRAGSEITDEDREEEGVEEGSERVFHHAAGLWLHAAAGLKVAETSWLCDVVHHYSAWTLKANGAGRAKDDEISGAPDEWNTVYLPLRARCFSALATQETRQFSISEISQLPDEAFLDVLPLFIRSLDAAYFEALSLNAEDAVQARSLLAKRLMGCRGWRYLKGKPDDSIEWHIGPAIAVLFFNDYLRPAPISCYLLPAGVERIEPFVPLLEELNRGAPCIFLALLTLNLMEVSPKGSLLALMLTAAEEWLNTYPDNTVFWLNHGIGQRVCGVIRKIVEASQTKLDHKRTLCTRADRLLAALVRIGVSEASALEEVLRSFSVARGS